MNCFEPEILITDQPLVPPPQQFSEAAGGVVEFYGVVRGREGATPIAGIVYEAYSEMAYHQLVKIATEAADLYPILRLVLHHRTGLVAAAEPSLYLRVTAAHRGPAFAAAEWLIVELKRRVPIWKHPVDEHSDAIPTEPGHSS